MNFKYVNPKAVDHVVGKYAPVGSFFLARIIEEALENTNLGFVHTEAGRGRFKSDDPVVSGALGKKKLMRQFPICGISRLCLLLENNFQKIPYDLVWMIDTRPSLNIAKCLFGNKFHIKHHIWNLFYKQPSNLPRE